MTGFPVTVVGVDGGPLGDAARAALAVAALVVGGERHLAAVAGTVGSVGTVGSAGSAGAARDAERVVLGPLGPALARLRAAPGPAVVLASGDPGFFGIVRRLRAEGFAVRVLPAVSSVAAAFARAGLPWDGAAVVSAHGRDLAPALNACRALPAVAVLTGPGAGPAELAEGLAGWPRRLVVAEHLGTGRERVTVLPATEAAGRDWADPNVLLVLRDPPEGGPDSGTGVPAVAGPRADNQPAAAPAGGWALPESAYRHRDSMITKAEVRAFAVARLRPRLGRLVWDVGAGSGSVGIECAALGAAVVAVDRDPGARELIAGNAARHGVEIRIETGTAPGALAGLPRPDAVFVGGGGVEVLAAVADRRPDRIVAGYAAIDRVAPAIGALRGRGYAVEGVQLSAARLADLPGGSFRLAATNPVVVLTAELEDAP